MGATAGADGNQAMGSVLRFASVLAAGIVVLSFLLFAVDQSREGSATQVDAVAGAKTDSPDAAIQVPAPAPEVERSREATHTGIRELIDDIDDVLLTPFTGVTSTNNVWVERIVPGGLGLLLYGFGGLLLANFIPRRPRHSAGWREATP